MTAPERSPMKFYDLSYTRHLEDLFRAMWSRFRSGEPPAGIGATA
jgi:hypothetical protein